MQCQAFRTEIDERSRLVVLSEDPVWGGLGDAFPAWQTSRRGAILQPPKPEVIPSARVLQLAAGHNIEPEAAD